MGVPRGRTPALGRGGPETPARSTGCGRGLPSRVSPYSPPTPAHGSPRSQPSGQPCPDLLELLNTRGARLGLFIYGNAPQTTLAGPVGGGGSLGGLPSA